LQSETEPLIVGAIGTVAGVLVLAGGIALFTPSKYLIALVQSATIVSIPSFIFSGVVKHYAGWPITVVGITLPLFLLLYTQKSAKGDGVLSKG
jgi:hypothetical protein